MDLTTNGVVVSNVLNLVKELNSSREILLFILQYQTNTIYTRRYERWYVCTKCTIEYWPKQRPVKKQSKFDLPGPPTDSHGNVIGDNDIPIAVIDDVNKEVSSTSYK
jgi:hypothetical protein